MLSVRRGGVYTVSRRLDGACRPQSHPRHESVTAGTERIHPSRRCRRRCRTQCQGLRCSYRSTRRTQTIRPQLHASPPPPQLINELSAPHRSLRIGVSLDAWGASVAIDPDVLASLEESAKRLEALGHTLVPLSPEEICDFKALRSSFSVAEWLLPISRELMHLTDEANVPLTDLNTSVQLRHHLALKDRYNIDDLFEAQMVTEALMCRWGDFWQSGACDVLLSPITPIACPKINSHYRMDSPQSFDEWSENLLTPPASRYRPTTWAYLPCHCHQDWIGMAVLLVCSSWHRGVMNTT